MRRFLVLLGELSGGADNLIDKPCQINRLGIKFELASFDLGEVEHLVEIAAPPRGPPATGDAVRARSRPSRFDFGAIENRQSLALRDSGAAGNNVYGGRRLLCRPYRD